MLGRQLLTDIGIILAAPIVVIGGYFLWGNPDTVQLLSEAPVVRIGADEPGAKTKLALDTLNGITLSDALFKDEAFTSLTTFSAEIPEVALSRDNPFVPPPAIAEKIRQARLNGVSKTATSVTTPLSLSEKIDQLKKASTR
jgi:hypothetical protein